MTASLRTLDFAVRPDCLWVSQLVGIRDTVLEMLSCRRRGSAVHLAHDVAKCRQRDGLPSSSSRASHPTRVAEPEPLGHPEETRSRRGAVPVRRASVLVFGGSVGKLWTIDLSVFQSVCIISLITKEVKFNLILGKRLRNIPLERCGQRVSWGRANRRKRHPDHCGFRPAQRTISLEKGRGGVLKSTTVL